MTLRTNVDMAFAALGASRFRTGLAVLGVTLGVGITILLVSIGQSAKVFVADKIRAVGFGSNVLVIHPGEIDPPVEPSKLTYEDAKYLQRKIPAILGLVPFIVGSGEARYGKRKDKTSVYGCTSNYPQLVRHGVAEGHFFTELDVDARRRVCLLGAVVRKNLFGEMTPLGERIDISGMKFICIGVMAKKGEMLGFNMDDMIIVPVTTAQSLLETTKLMEIAIWLKEGESVREAKRRAEDLLTRRHLGTKDFHFHMPSELLSILDVIIRSLTLFVIALSGVSLVVGSIGIMNIMLASVSERYREIGIRKAVGARDADIRTQFLCEALFISLLGGAIGTAVGIAGAAAISVAIGFPIVIIWWVVVLAFVFSCLVGISAGVLPAVRAARLSPVDALRYE